MKLRLYLSLIGAILLLMAPAAVHAQSFAAKINAGSMGLGLEAVVDVHPNLNVRVGGNFFGASYLYETDADAEFDFDTDASLNSFTALVDFHPFGNSFRLTGGLVYNRNEFTGTLIPKQTYTLGGDTYTPDDLGTIDVTIDHPDIAPYIAAGFGNAFTGSSFGFNVDVGIFYMQEPRVSMRADGILAPTAAQGPQMEKNLDWANIYPVLTLSLYYRIN